MKRYKGLEIVDGDDLTPGDYYLIRRVYHLRGGETTYRLSTEPGRTNMSHRALTSGWLGTTNDVGAYADGCVRVTRDAKGRLRIRALPVAEMIHGEECGS